MYERGTKVTMKGCEHIDPMPKSARRSAYGFQKDIEVIEIHVDPPQAQGFGYTVYCDGCGYDERMLSGPGAREIAQEHLHEHIMVVDSSNQ